MAEPTIHYFEAAAGTNAALLSIWMPKLQELLFDAGWTLEYADADAIGGGSAEVPAWDKTPATNTDAGIAVYRMPANGHDTRWFVRTRPGWPANISRTLMRGLQIGVAHDGNGTVSTGASEMVPSTGALNHNGLEWAVSVSEDGFAFIHGNEPRTPVFSVERARTPAGAVLDAVIAWNKHDSTGVAGRHADANVGQVSTAQPLMLAAAQFSGTTTTLPSLESIDSSGIVVLGPYYPGGDYLFPPGRLAFLASPADVAPGGERLRNIDGGNKTYKAMPGSVSGSAGIWLLATE